MCWFCLCSNKVITHIGIKMSTISPLFTSKYRHGQYHTLKVEYLLPMLAFTKIIVLYNFRYKKLSKPCTQLLRYKQLKQTIFLLN